ncbi:MAG: YybH family protein [Bacteroidota bacterium]
MKTFLIFLVIFTFSTRFTFSLTFPEIHGDSAVADEIITIRKMLVKAENNVELESLRRADIFTEDAVMMPGNQHVAGADSILSVHEGIFSRWKSADVQVHIEQIYTMGRLAVEIGWYEGTVEFKNGNTRYPEGKYLYTYQKGKDGKWRIHQMSWGSDFN